MSEKNPRVWTVAAIASPEEDPAYMPFRFTYRSLETAKAAARADARADLDQFNEEETDPVDLPDSDWKAGENGCTEWYFEELDTLYVVQETELKA